MSLLGQADLLWLDHAWGAAFLGWKSQVTAFDVRAGDVLWERAWTSPLRDLRLSGHDVLVRVAFSQDVERLDPRSGAHRR